METERKQSLTSVLVHTIIGIIIGYASIFLPGVWTSLGLAIVVLVALIFGLKKVLKIQKDKKWWIGNGIIVYIFFWLVSWILFFNLVQI